MQDTFSKKLSVLGAGTGLTLFVIFGLVPGAFLGGVLGLNIGNFLFGGPLMPTIVSRILVAGGMLVGVFLAGLIFTAGGTSLGWLVGVAIDQARKGFHKPAAEAEK
ncbi:MAG: hypothetical protein P8Y66_10200 [Nitrospirota bacterium]|jgi:hypothetical protein